MNDLILAFGLALTWVLGTGWLACVIMDKANIKIKATDFDSLAATIILFTSFFLLIIRNTGG